MNNDVFETMPVPKAYFKMALPVVFGMVISLVYNMVDTWFYCKDPEHQPRRRRPSLRPVFSLMIAFGDIFGLGGSSAISRLFGKKDYDTARRISAFCLLGSIFFGIAVAVLCCFFRHPFCIFWVPGTIPSPMPAPITAFWFSAALPLSLILSRGICSAQKVWQMMP